MLFLEYNIGISHNDLLDRRDGKPQFNCINIRN